MKTARIIGSFMVGMMVFSNSIYSQQDSTKGKVEFDIKVDVLLPIISLFVNSQNNNSLDNVWVGALTLEASFAVRQSLQLEGLLVYQNNQQNTFEIIPEWKYYLSKRNPYCGFYSGIFFNYIRSDLLSSEISNNYSSYEWGIGGGGLFGYQNSISEHFIFDLIIGIGASKIIYGWNNYPIHSFNSTNLDLIYGFNIGYKF
jgi:hypothetical protein